jgi:Cu(I)/Ag(I) efflux system membrane protein CusA/SilA
VNRVLIRLYRPIIAAVMRWKKLTIMLAVIVAGSRRSTRLTPGLGVHADPQRRHFALHAHVPARHVDHQGGRADADPGQDHQEFPGSRIGLGKAGRANTATDPAPTEMFETVINLKPQHRMAPGHDDRQADRRTGQGAAVPGVANAWTMPIKARTDMLSTGIRTPIGIKVFGKDLGEMENWLRRSRPSSKRCPAPPVPLPSASPVASTSTSSPTGNSWPATV